jgi:hypothetical protein
MLGWMTDTKIEKIEPKEIWVDLREAAELTGYNLESIRKVAYRIAQQSEDEREIKIRKRSSRWEFWLPDLITYVKRPLRGARPNDKKQTSLDSTR